MELTLDQALKKGIEAHKAGQITDADRYYTAILKAQPSHPDANHNMGVLAVGVGKVQEALPFFKTALEANSNIAQFWLSYIDALIKLNRVVDAKAVLDEAKSKDLKADEFDQIKNRLSNEGGIDRNKTYKKILVKAVDLKESGKYDEAIDILLYQIKKSPKDPNIPALLSHCYILNDNLEKARIYLDAAKDINPKIASVGWNETRLLLKQKKVNEALAIADKTNKLFPDDIEGMGVLGSCLRANGNFDESLKYLNKAIELNPNYAEALINRGLIYQNQEDKVNALRDLENAYKKKPHIKQIWNLVLSLKMQAKEFESTIALAEEMIEIDPLDEKIIATKALCYHHIKNYDQALIFYNKSLSIKPDYAEAFNNIGNTLQEQGKLKEAIETYNKAISIKPDYAEAFNNIGNTLQKQGKLEEAVEAYNKALSIKPDYAEVFNNMGIAFREQGKLEEAIEAYKKTLSLQPDHAEAYNHMGIAFYEQGKLEEAIEAYSKAISIKPNFAEAYNHMGISLNDQGNLEEAIETYNKALSIKPNFAEAFTNLLILRNQLRETMLIIENKKEQLKLPNFELVDRPTFLIHQAISGFLKADHSLVRKYLKEFRNCDPQLIEKLPKKDKTFCLAYNLFLQKLIKTLSVNKPTFVNHQTVFHLGESHCLSYAHKQIKIQGMDYTVVPKITFGGKVYHISREKKDCFKSITKANFESIPKASKVFISFGEIDCRPNEGFISAASKINRTKEDLIGETVRRYINWFDEQNQNKNHSLFFFNVPAPIYNEKFTAKVNEEVVSIIKLFNNSIHKTVLDYDFNIIDVYKVTVGHDGFSNGSFHLDNYHLSSDAIFEIEKQIGA